MEHTYVQYMSKRMQQTCRSNTDQRGVPCTVLIPLCALHFYAIPESALSCKATQSLDCGTFPMKTLCISPIRGMFGKKHRNTLPAQIQRQTIKVWHVSYQNAAQSILISVALFLTYTDVRIWYMPPVCIVH